VILESPACAPRVRATGTRRKVSIRSRPAVWAGVVVGRGPNGSKEGSGPAGEPPVFSPRITLQMGGKREKFP